MICTFLGWPAMCGVCLHAICWIKGPASVLTALFAGTDDAVCMQGGMDLSPHLYVLPLELTPFMEVLAALGAQEAFSAAQYTTVLQVRLHVSVATSQKAHAQEATNQVVW